MGDEGIIFDHRVAALVSTDSNAHHQVCKAKIILMLDIFQVRSEIETKI